MLISNGNQKMKMHSRSRDLPGRPAPLPPARLGLSVVCKSPVAGCEQRSIDHASLLTNHYSRITQFLIGCAPIKNRRIPLKLHAMFFSNRSKRACLRTRFSSVLHVTDHDSQLSTRAFLIATQLLEIRRTCSQQTRKLFLIATFFRCLAYPRHLAARQSHAG
jgi:hypothetical protein